MTVLQQKSTNGKKNEEMFNILNHIGNANQNNTEIPSHSSLCVYVCVCVCVCVALGFVLIRQTLYYLSYT
jgi:hypothetical protein